MTIHGLLGLWIVVIVLVGGIVLLRDHRRAGRRTTVPNIVTVKPLVVVPAPRGDVLDAVRKAEDAARKELSDRDFAPRSGPSFYELPYNKQGRYTGIEKNARETP